MSGITAGGITTRHITARRMTGRVLCLMMGILVCSLGSCVGAAGAREIGSSGDGAGQLNAVAGVAVDQRTGYLYVADKQNQRVDEFDATTGVFVRAWGWGVAEEPGTQKPELERCTTKCYRGLGSTGVGIGGMYYLEGIAVDEEGGHEAVYVLEPRNHRVQQFSLEGKFVAMFGGKVNKTTGADVCTAVNVSEGDECQPGTEGTGPGEFVLTGSRENAIAVGASGMVYVGDQGAGGEGRVEKFNSSGVYQSEFKVPGVVEVRALAAGGGHLYLAGNASVAGYPLPKVLQYSEGGAFEGSIALGGPEEERHVWLAADAEGDVFVDAGYTPLEVSARGEQLLEYNSVREQILRLLAPGVEEERANVFGLALIEPGPPAVPTEVVVGGEYVLRTALLPPPGPVVFSEEAEPKYPVSATLKAVVDPEGYPGVKYHFEYGPSPSEETAVGSGTLGSGFDPEVASAEVSGLTPKETYYYHVVVEDSEGHVTEGPPLGEAEHHFVAPPALRIDSVSVSDVTSESATLEAQVNPLKTDTICWFEYSTGGAVVKTASVDIGSGEGDVPVRAHIQNLVAGSLYTYTVIATNKDATEPIVGERLQFRSFPAASALLLPDGRMWEQVSPATKQAAAFEGQPREGGLIKAAANGSAITYISRTTTEARPQGEPAYEWAQIISKRATPGAWASKDIATAHDERWHKARVGEVSEYRLFSEDLGLAAVEPMGATPLSTLTTERTPYMRTQTACEASEGPSGGCYTPLVTGGETQPEIPAGTEFSGKGEPPGGVVVAGGNPSLSVVLFNSEVPLIEGAGAGGLYAWTDGRLRLVSVLPGGAPLSGCQAKLGAHAYRDARDAVSPDGSMVAWSESSVAPCRGHLYLRDLSTATTTQLDVVQEHGSGAGTPDAVYQDAGFDAQGRISRVFFTDTQRLTEGATAGEGEPDLYEYDVATGTLIDLAQPVNPEEAADVQGALPGVAEDGTDVYVVAQGVLTSTPNEHGEEAEAGAENLYLLHTGVAGGEPVFIARLATADHRDWGQIAAGGQELHPIVGNLVGRVSPDGQWLAFMSQRPLTGYDNRDVLSGEPDEEAYLYNATSGRLVCASCNPAGERPSGIYDVAPIGQGPLVDRRLMWREHWVAAALPAWEGLTVSGELALYQPRYLSNDGQLFFDSPEALVPQDINHTWDVYEYEPPQGGSSAASDSCTVSASTYVQAAGGCVSLISSGTSPDESAFLDASTTGDDAFFMTSAQLTSTDTDTAYDVYDAHACTSLSPCPPASSSTPHPCESISACQTTSQEPPSEATFLGGAPSSLTFNGKGNLATPTKAKTTSKKRTGKNGSHKTRARCLAKAKRIKNHKRRRHALKRCRKASHASAMRRHHHQRRHRARSARHHQRNHAGSTSHHQRFAHDRRRG